MSATPICYEVITDLDPAMQDVVPEGMTYLVLGGIASAAICHPRTRFDMEDDGSGVVWAAPESGDLITRVNGTSRDIDVLITGVLDDTTSGKIKDTIAEVTEGKLEVSVFGFEAHRPHETKASRRKSASNDWISRRTIDENGVLRYELFPLEKVVAPETYTPWTLVMPKSGAKIQVLHPVGHRLAYNMRSISGERTKDRAKIAAMQKSLNVVPGLMDAVHDGPFFDWLAFAESIAYLNTHKAFQGLRAPISRHEAATIADVRAFRLKGKILHLLESNDMLVKLAQDDGAIQKALNLFVGAK